MTRDDIHQYANSDPNRRPGLAADYLSDHAVDAEVLDGILEEVYAERLPAEGEAPVLAAIFGTRVPGELRERAIRALYYLTPLWEAADDAERAEAAKGMLDQLARTAQSQEDAYTRGRLYWLRLRRLRDEGAPNARIADEAKAVMLSEPDSEYVRNRVGAALQEWPGLLLLLPTDGSWEPPESPYWQELNRTTVYWTMDAGRTLEHLQSRMPKLLRSVSEGRIPHQSVSLYIDFLPSPLRDYLVPAKLVSKVCAASDAAGRNAVIATCSKGLRHADLERLRSYLAALESIIEDSGKQENWPQ